MGWVDDIIFAMCPLGIITAMVSAIRAGGVTWLKALIGRSRETRGSIELELFSSTSPDVSELFFSEEGIARVAGSDHKIEQWLFQRPKLQSKLQPKIYNANSAYDDKIPEPSPRVRFSPAASSSNESSAQKSFRPPSSEPALESQEVTEEPPRKKVDAPIVDEYSLSSDDESSDSRGGGTKNSSPVPENAKSIRKKLDSVFDWLIGSPGLIEIDPKQPPNVLLNFHSTPCSPLELWGVAVVGLLLQSTVVMFAALVTYWWKWPKTGSFVAPYGYPLTAAGTLMVSVGLIMCARVVEASTDEVVWNRKKDTENLSHLGIIWLQKAEQKNTDTGFRSMAILGSKEKKMKGGLRTFRTSQRNAKTHRTAVYVGVCMALLGYLSQLIGFRTLHSAVPLVQFGATLVMTALRAWVRRGLSERPDSIQLPNVPPGHEQDWLSLYVGNCTEWYVQAGLEEDETLMSDPNKSREETSDDGVGQRVMQLRYDKARLSSWQLSVDSSAFNLAKAIQNVVTEKKKQLDIFPYSFKFTLRILARPRIRKDHNDQPGNVARPPEISNTTLQPENAELFRQQVQAVLSLWLHEFERKKKFAAPSTNRTFIYVASKASPNSYLFCYKWICQNPTNWLTVSVTVRRLFHISTWTSTRVP